MDNIARLELLDRDECETARASVFELRDRWLRRDPELPFFTLGAASYLDARPDPQNYYSIVRDFNPLLSRRFAWLYEKLAARLAAHWGARVKYAPDLALPGYHVYLAHPVFEQPVASIHCDTQYQLLDWTRVESADFVNPMSFTLSIALPQCGGGLNIWPQHYGELVGRDPGTRANNTGSRTPDYFPYALGELALHSGHMVHQAAPARRLREGDERITLQGHALACGDTWILYW